MQVWMRLETRSADGGGRGGFVGPYQRVRVIREKWEIILILIRAETHGGWTRVDRL